MRMNLFLGLCILALSTFASAKEGKVGGTEPSAGGTELRIPSPPSENAISNERWGITPQLGYISYSGIEGGDAARGAVGATLDYNTLDSKTNYLGGSVGIIYSHLGQTRADFYGNNASTAGGDSTAYALQFPLNAKAGYNVTDSMRLSLHGGGNLFYRSVASTMNLGTARNTDAALDFFPNLGADAELGLTRDVGLLLRPDLIFSLGNTVFTGTLGLIVALR